MKKPHVLVVDDCPDARLLMRLMLTPRGYSVEEAESSVQASALLFTEAFDVVVLDVAMADMDGFDLAMEIRNGVLGDLNTNAIIVGCSGLYLGKRDLSKAATGMDLFFMKPIIVHEFVENLDSLVGRLVV